MIIPLLKVLVAVVILAIIVCTTGCDVHFGPNQCVEVTTKDFGPITCRRIGYPEFTPVGEECKNFIYEKPFNLLLGGNAIVEEGVECK